MRTRSGAVIGALALAALGAALPAAASEVTRASYREAVEPICQADTQANERIFRGVRGEVRRGELKPAAQRFERGAKALAATVARLRGVPPPPEDAERIERWFAAVETEVGYFKAVAAKLRAGEKLPAERMVVRLVHQAEVANAVMVPFQLRYCRLDPSRFT